MIADCPYRRLDPTIESVLVDLNAWDFMSFFDDRISWKADVATFCDMSSLIACIENGRALVDNFAESWAGYLEASSEGCSSVESDCNYFGAINMTLHPWVFEV